MGQLATDSTETSNRNSVASSVEPKIIKQFYSDRRVLEAVLFKFFTHNILVLFRNSALSVRHLFEKNKN